MGVRILDQTYTTRDFTTIAVCMSYYLNNRGVSDENYNVIRVLRNILSKIPQDAQNNLIEMFDLSKHLDYSYSLEAKNNNDFIDKYLA